MDYRSSKASTAYKQGTLGTSNGFQQGRSSAYGQSDGDRPHVRFSGVNQESNAHRHTNFGGTGSNDGGFGRQGGPTDASGSMMRGILNETNQKSAGTTYRPSQGMDPNCRSFGN